MMENLVCWGYVLRVGLPLTEDERVSRAKDRLVELGLG
jgi:hypothetical protein